MSTHTPPHRASKEATAEQLALARAQGEAYERAVEAMKKESGHWAEDRAGEYIVTCAVEEAEGLYLLGERALEWHAPTDENAHIEIAVRDGADGRFVPGLAVVVTVIDAHGRELGSHPHPLLWHPWLYHYGRNWALPGDGTYSMKVRIAPPSFARHDRTNGRRFEHEAEVVLPAFRVKTGQKK